MPYHMTKIGIAVQMAPEVAAKRIVGLFKKYRGRTVEVAKACGVSTSTVKRWITVLDQQGCEVRGQIEQLRDV